MAKDCDQRLRAVWAQHGQVKGQEFQREIARTMAQTPQVVANLRELRSLDPKTAGAGAAAAAEGRDANPALEAWRRAG